MGMHDNDHCINCMRAVTGPEQKFCPGCGQPTPARRIDWGYVGHELEHGVLQMDRGLLYSLKLLMLQPGRLLRDYIEGRRGNQAKPLLLLTVTAAAVVLLSRFFLDGGVLKAVSMDPATAVDAGSAAAQRMARLVAASQAVAGWINANFATFTLLLLPIEAGVRWAVFRRYSRLNYPEWLVISTLLVSQVFVVWMALLALHRWLPQLLQWVALFAVAYCVFSLVQFFQGRPPWQTLWRALLAELLFMVIGQVLMAVAILALVVLG
ncbi:DUF3667 domain-containing protein [Stenotrophomonas acidaminiphila]